MRAEQAPLPEGFALVAAGRFVTNVAFRLVFPFLPRIAAGLGVSLTTMGSALAFRELAGAAAPLLGRSADRRGHAHAMVVGLAALGATMVLQGASAGLWLFTLGLIIASLAKNLFDAGSAAWVGDVVHFTARGRAMGMIEMSWAAAFIVGMPIAALLIRISTWRTPFLVAALMCVLMALVLHTRLRGATRDRTDAPAMTWTRTIVAAVATITAIGIGHSQMLVTFASWLEDEHAVSVSGLGLTAVVIGLSELCGSGGSALLGDRIGLRRGLRTALALAVPASALVMAGSASLPLALALMALYFVVVEFAVVALLSLFTELDNVARGTVMGWAFAGFTLGHAVGAVLGSQLYDRSGMPLNAVVMAATFALAWAIVTTNIGEPEAAR